MKERPILFSAPMVRAILDGRKTQTRRVVKPQPIADERFVGGYCIDRKGRQTSVEAPYVGRDCPYGQPDDRLWVREAWSTHACFDSISPAGLTTRSIHYLADGKVLSGKGRPSIHMPRLASRITLEITGVRVERLQDISEDDCWAEGIESVDGIFDDQIHAIAKRIGCCAEDAKPTYCALWESINGDGSWEANPWVWVVEFKRVEGGAA